jgi:general secretion pathway protein D
LKYLFGQETKERQQSEIVFAITPHIIRGGEVTDENLKMVDIGSANSVTYRRDDSKIALANPLPVQPPAKSSDKTSTSSAAAKP